MSRTSPFILVLTTVGRSQEAERLASLFVRKRLVACVNIVPGLVSHYFWKGKVCRDKEFLLILKTRREKLASLERVLVRNHSYETPEMVVLPIQAGLKKYLSWITNSVRSSSGW